MKQENWKTYGIISVIVIVLALIIKKVFFNGEGDLQSQINRLIIEGIRHDKNKEYQTAIYYFKKILSLTNDPNILKDTYFAIAGCYLSLKKYEEAITFCNKSLEIDLVDNLITLNIKYRCNKLLGRKEECLRDMILYNSFRPSKTNENKIDMLSQSISSMKATEYCKTNMLPPSNIKYSGFFDTLIGVLPLDEDDEVVYFIRQKKYERLNDFFFKSQPDQTILKSIDNSNGVSSNKLYSRNLIHACLHFLKGNYEETKNLLKESSSNFDLVFLEYLKSISSDYIPNNTILNDESITSSDNPSILFYLSKIYSNYREDRKYIFYISKILDHPFACVDLISYYEDNKNTDKLNELAKDCTEKFGSEPTILYACAKAFLLTDQRDLLNEYLSEMEENDARTQFIKGLVYTNDDDASLEYFRKAKDIDLTYHDAYLFICNILLVKDPVECKNIVQESLEIASCYDEVYVSIKTRLFLENQEYVKSMKSKFN